MNIEQLTLSEIRQIAALLQPQAQNQIPNLACNQAHPYPVGKNVFIRTVTHHHTGKLVEVTPTELVLTDAAWIADDGRLTDALTSCSFGEVELFPTGSQVIIGRGSIIDCVEISKLPKFQK